MAGEECCANPPVLMKSCGSGSEQRFGGLRCYYVSSATATATAAILLVSDVYGFEAPNLRSLADKIAAAGFYVVVPDFLDGDYFDPSKNPIAVWVKAHSPEKAFQDSKAVIQDLRSQLQDVTAIGAAGFCWGAKVVTELAKSDAKLIQAGVIVHPSFVTVDDIKEVKVNFAVLGATFDHISPPELVHSFKPILAANANANANQIDSFVKVFPGVGHGWSVRYDVNDELAVKNAEEAHSDMINWFLKHLK